MAIERFTKDHEWIRVDGGIGTVGITHHAQTQLGDIVFVDVPETDPDQTPKPPMSSDKRWRTVAAESKAGQSATLTAKQDVTTRYVLVYLTSLPKEGNGYRGGIYEVEVQQ